MAPGGRANPSARTFTPRELAAAVTATGHRCSVRLADEFLADFATLGIVQSPPAATGLPREVPAC